MEGFGHLNAILRFAVWTGAQATTWPMLSRLGQLGMKELGHPQTIFGLTSLRPPLLITHTS